MTPNQLPPLPETEYSLFYEQDGGLDDEGFQYVLDAPGFTAAQMHAYALAALAQQAQEPVANEREAFEASMREKHGWSCKDFAIDDDGGYFDGHTATAWLAWQARAILALRPAVGPMTPEFMQAIGELSAAMGSPAVRGVAGDLVTPVIKLAAERLRVMRPQAAPMTDEQRALIIGRAADKTADRSAAALYAICETERLYGITAKAEGGCAMAPLPSYRCLRCGFWSYETPQHKCTPRPISAHQPTKEQR